MKIIDSNDNVFSCKIGSPLIGVKLKKAYFFTEEVEAFDEWEKYEEFLKSKFISDPFIKINKRFA